MSNYSNVTEQELFILRKIAAQLKNERALQFKIRILKQTHDKKLAEIQSPISKKSHEVNESTTKIGETIRESNSEKESFQEVSPVEIVSEDENDNIQYKIRALPNSNKLSSNLLEFLGALMNSENTLELLQDNSIGASILRTPIYTLGGDRIRKNDNIYVLTPEIYKFLSSTSYNGKTLMDENDYLMMNNVECDINYTGVVDKSSKRKIFLSKKLPKMVESSQNKTFHENIDSSNDLQGGGVKIIIPSALIDIYTRLEILLGLKLSGYTDTLTEASNLIDEIYKRREIQNERQYRYASNNFFSTKMEFPSKLFEQIASNRRPKIEEHILIVMDKSTHEEHLSQPLQTNKKQFKIAITFLTGYNGIFNVTNSKTNSFSQINY